MKHSRHVNLLLVLLTLFLAPLAAAAEDVIIGPDGSVFKLLNGTYGALFPGGVEAPPNASVLALDVLREGKLVERRLVPETESLSAELSATFHNEERANSIYLLWEGLLNGAHPQLYITSFDGESWSEVIEITGGIFATKGHPQLVIRRDANPTLKALGLSEDATERAVIFLAWWEKIGQESYKRLAPLILQDGMYIGWNPLLTVAGLLPEKAEGVAVDPNIENALRLQPGSRTSSVTMGFLNSDTGRLMALEVEILPRELSQLAERVSELVLELGAEASSNEELAHEIRQAVLDYGIEFHPGSLGYLANQIYDFIMTRDEGEPIEILAPKAGIHIIHIGVRFKAHGLEDPLPVDIIEISQNGENGGAPYHHLKAVVLADREAPAVGGQVQLFLSHSGFDALVAWDVENGVSYRETRGQGWGAVRTVLTSENLDRARIYSILAERTWNR